MVGQLMKVERRSEKREDADEPERKVAGDQGLHKKNPACTNAQEICSLNSIINVTLQTETHKRPLS